MLEAAAPKIIKMPMPMSMGELGTRMFMELIVTLLLAGAVLDFLYIMPNLTILPKNFILF